MKKTIVMVLMTLSGVVQAGDYSRAAKNQKTCEFFGKMAYLLNAGKKEGKPLESVIVTGGAAEELMNKVTRELYASHHSDEQAFSMGWATCMDFLTKGNPY